MLLISERTKHAKKSSSSHRSQMLTSPYHRFGAVNGKRQKSKTSYRRNREFVRVKQGQRTGQEEQKKIRRLTQREKTGFCMWDLLPRYLLGCFWRAWWTVEYVADISPSSLLESVCQRSLFYPDELRKQKKEMSKESLHLLPGCFSNARPVIVYSVAKQFMAFHLFKDPFNNCKKIPVF